MKRKTTESKGSITSVDGKTTITLEEFDRRAEAGEPILEFFDLSKAKRLGDRALKPGEMVTIREVDEATGKVLRVRRYRHGGKRPGAGRKGSGRSGRTLRLADATWAKLDARAEGAGVSVREVIEGLVG